MDIPAIQVVRGTNEPQSNAILLSEACELYLRLRGVGKDKVLTRTANLNTGYVTRLLSDRPISLYSSNEAAQFRDWCIDKGMDIKTVKCVFLSIKVIVNLAKAEAVFDCSNASATKYIPNDDNAQVRQPVPLEDMKRVQFLCREVDDEMRWLIAFTVILQ